MKKIKRFLLLPLLWLAAALFLIEEFIWDSTAKIMARLGAISAVHAIENRIEVLPPRLAILAFLLPSGILIPAKLIGLHAISQGHWLLGSLTFVVAKIAGMAFFSRIFNLTRPALLQINWFASLYNWVMLYRNRIHAYLDNWAEYQRIKRLFITTFRMIKGKGRLLRYLRRVSRLKINGNTNK